MSRYEQRTPTQILAMAHERAAELELKKRTAKHMAEAPAYPGLTPAQTGGVVALIYARSVSAAARDSGIPLRTLTEWMRLPAFATALQTAQDELIGDALRGLSLAAGLAVDVLATVAKSPNTPPAARIKAAEAILSHTANMRAAARVERAEARADAERVQLFGPSAGMLARVSDDDLQAILSAAYEPPQISSGE